MTLDFAMKHMPLHPRESTVDWYGQRGMPWHITHVTTPINEQYYQHNLVHIFKGERQVCTTISVTGFNKSISRILPQSLLYFAMIWRN